jgi:hypothetical protein
VAPGDVVLVYDPDRLLPFAYYFRPIAPTTPVYTAPVDISLETYDPAMYAIPDTASVAARLLSLHAVGHPIWFVTAAEVLGPLKAGPGLVRAYLAAHDHLQDSVSFAGVRLVRAQPPAPRD